MTGPVDTTRLDEIERAHYPVEWQRCGDDGTLDPAQPLPPFCAACTNEEYAGAVEYGDVIDEAADVVSWPCIQVDLTREVRRLSGAVQRVEAECADLERSEGGWDRDVAARFRAALGDGQAQPDRPTFDQLLRDPNEQFDTKSELREALMRSIEEYRNAPSNTASAPAFKPDPRATYAADQCPQCHRDNGQGGWQLCEACAAQPDGETP